MGVWVEGVEGHGRVPLQGRAARQAGREVGAAALGSPRHPAVLLRAGVVGNGAMGRGGFRSLVGGGGEGLVDWVSGGWGGGRGEGETRQTRGTGHWRDLPPWNSAYTYPVYQGTGEVQIKQWHTADTRTSHVALQEN